MIPTSFLHPQLSRLAVVYSRRCSSSGICPFFPDPIEKSPPLSVWWVCEVRRSWDSAPGLDIFEHFVRLEYIKDITLSHVMYDFLSNPIREISCPRRRWGVEIVNLLILFSFCSFKLPVLP